MASLINADTKNLVKLPKQFTKKTLIIAIGAVVFFAIYFAFVAFFIWLLSFSFSSTIILLNARLSFITALIFIGANGFVAMILVLLLRMLIPSGKNKDEDSEVKLEIKPNDHPELFKAIYEVADSVNTYRPRKVFLLPDVNASVFHERNFFSLFIPSHQNLNIGLGLVNSLSVVEFKAVLAHEFGHFSQNVTRVSGFTYRINKLIISLLYSDDSWFNTIRGASSISAITAIFGGLTLFTAAGIRWVFQKIYELVNLPYLSLSRDLEFHADAVAVTLMGQESLINALRKIDFTNLTYNSTTSELSDFFSKEKLVGKNLYKVHQNITQHYAAENNLKLVNNQPVIAEENLNKLITTRVFYVDQWASHPSQEEREANIKKYGQSLPYEAIPAWSLFNNEVEVQEQLTELIYKPALKENNEVSIVSADEIISKLEIERKKNKVNPIFNNFYSNRTIEIDIEQALEEYDAGKAELIPFDAIYNAENKAKIDRFFVDTSDKEKLEAIKNKQIRVSVFEFEGKKYKRRQAAEVIKKLADEISQQSQWLLNIDKKAFWFNVCGAEKKGEQTKQEYITCFRQYLSVSASITTILGYAEFLGSYIANYSATVQDEDDLKPFLQEIRSKEKKFKKDLNTGNALLLNNFIADEKQRDDFVNYITNTSKFFFNLFSITDVEVNNSFEFLNDTIGVFNPLRLETLKKLSDMQEQWAVS